MMKQNRRGSSNPTRKFQVDKLKNSVRRWREAMVQYSNQAEREYNKIKAQVRAGQTLMTDAELKFTYKLLSKK